MSGELLIGDERADSGTVVLHQVSAFFTGQVDSARVGADGRFTLALPGPMAGEGGAAGEVYFASTRYQGVLYFGGPVTEPADLEGVYRIRAYPTQGARAEAPLPVRVRNTFVQRPASGAGWEVTDLFEIENRGASTIVASEEGAAWSHPLPPEGEGFQVGSSDLNPEAASFSGGRVHTSAAIPPGEAVYLFRYRIPGDAFTLPLTPGTASMELLFREPAGELEVSGLAGVGPVEMEGGTFRRFAGRDLASSVVTVAPASVFNPSGTIPVVAAILLLALTGAGAVLAMRPRRRPALSRREVVLGVARLDEEWRLGTLAETEYARRRAELLRQLEP